MAPGTRRQRTKTKDELTEDFIRTSKVTAGLMKAAAELSAENPDREVVPLAEMVSKLRKITGLDLSTEYIDRAIELYQQTGKFVEDSQLNDSPEEH